VIVALQFLMWSAVAVGAYVYVGYPLLLWAVGKTVERPVHKAPITPSVTVIIAAHNEEQQLAAKIKNTLALDYPQDRIEIIIASDGSTDGTEDVAARFEREGVGLLRLPRCGKMQALNQAVARSASEILVFTDANAELERRALKELVAPFADIEIGGVCGNQKYGRAATAGDSAAAGEDLYWTFDKYLKELETRVGSTIAADGSLYAMRRELYVVVEDGAQADDFAVSARVVTSGGRRLVYEPEAVSFEPAPAASDQEFWRKVRVANHGIRAILALDGGLNPLRTGFYAIEMWSHKLLRYLLPLFAVGALAASAVLALHSVFYFALLVAQAAFYALAVAGCLLRRTPFGRLKPFYAPFYFCLANAAALLAILSLLKGERIAIWQPQREVTQVGGA
jgi:cellulose synthase/poly-beta-1,6-N-acetylglucosamine synthase-like glycosyltransferase